MLGYSLGSSIVTNHILSNSPLGIESVALISPPFSLPNTTIVNPITAPFIKYFKPWFSHNADLDMMQYESFTSNGGIQAHFLNDEIRKKLKNNNSNLKETKLFIALSYEDKTVNLKNVLKIILENTDPKRRHIVIYHQNHLPQNLINQRNIYPVKSSIAESRILSLAHISIPFKAKNFWYGENGKYKDCRHYYDTKDSNKNHTICKLGNNVNYGETTKQNLSKGVMVRLTHNPFFDKLLNSLSDFWDL